MKKLLLFIAIITCINTSAQVVPVLTTTLTPGSGDFLVDKSHYPFDAFVLYILSADTGKVGLNYTMTGGTFLTAKQRVKYIDGRTGHSFTSITRLQQFYDSFMVSPPFTTTIAGDLNITGDATAANQASEISDLDSLLKWQTNGGVTVRTLSIADTVHVPAGSLVIGGVKSAGTAIGLTDITGTTAVEQSFIDFTSASTIPMQSYKGSATAHTITAAAACSIFILTLH